LERRAVGDRRDRHGETGELYWRQRLAEDRPAQQSPRDRRGETEERRRGGGEVPDSVEPQHEGERRTDQAEIREASGTPCAHGRRGAFADGGQRGKDEPAEQQLPAGRGDPVRRRGESLRQHNPDGERGIGADRGQHAHRVNCGAWADHDEGDADGGDQADGQVERSRSPPADEPRQGGDE
jgi:hypothetical protein